MRPFARPRRQAGQGMTEYAVLLGLLAILLIGAVLRYGQQIYVTIVGTNTAMDHGILDPMSGGGGAGGGGGGNRPTGTHLGRTGSGWEVYDDGGTKYAWYGSHKEPYNSTTHGGY